MYDCMYAREIYTVFDDNNSHVTVPWTRSRRISVITWRGLCRHGFLQAHDDDEEISGELVELDITVLAWP